MKSNMLTKIVLVAAVTWLGTSTGNYARADPNRTATPPFGFKQCTSGVCFIWDCSPLEVKLAQPSEIRIQPVTINTTVNQTRITQNSYRLGTLWRQPFLVQPQPMLAKRGAAESRGSGTVGPAPPAAQLRTERQGRDSRFEVTLYAPESTLWHAIGRGTQSDRTATGGGLGLLIGWSINPSTKPSRILMTAGLLSTFSVGSEVGSEERQLATIVGVQLVGGLRFNLSPSRNIGVRLGLGFQYEYAKSYGDTYGVVGSVASDFAFRLSKRLWLTAPVVDVMFSGARSSEPIYSAVSAGFGLRFH